MIFVRNCCASRMAAAVFPAAVGPTMIITVLFIFRWSGLFPTLFFFRFGIRVGIGVRLRFAGGSYQAKPFGAFGEVIFLFDLGKLVAHQPLSAILRRRNSLGFDDGGIFQFAAFFFRHVDQLHQKAPVLDKIVYVDKFLIGIEDLRSDRSLRHQQRIGLIS